MQVLLSGGEVQKLHGLDAQSPAVLAIVQRFLDGNGGVRGVVSLLASNKPKTVNQTSIVLRRLAEQGPEQCRAIADAGAIERFLSLLSHSDACLATCACDRLLFVIRDASDAIRAVATGALPALMHAAARTRVAARYRALACVGWITSLWLIEHLACSGMFFSQHLTYLDQCRED